MADTAIAEETGVKYVIAQDEDAENPREWDNIGTMACFHKRYNLGDKHDYRHEDYSSWDELEAAIRKNEDVAVIAPLFLYDHSGLRVKIGSFQGLLPQGHAEFDSGQIGFIFVSKKKARQEYGKLTKAALAKVEKYLAGEVEVYDQYLSGDVWWFKKVDEDGEILDSCGGFYGYDIEKNGMRESIPKDAVVEYE